jgi:hypothetical protein
MAHPGTKEAFPGAVEANTGTYVPSSCDIYFLDKMVPGRQRVQLSPVTMAFSQLVH